MVDKCVLYTNSLTAIGFHHFAVLCRDPAADQHIIDAFGGKHRLGEGGVVLDLPEIKDGDIRVSPYIQSALGFKPQPGSWQSRHFFHSLI